jgi:anti-anti-sigma factor
MTVLANIVESRHGDVAVARLEGEIDASNVRWAEERLRALVTNQAKVLVVDLTATTYLDSAGIALLFELAAALGRHQQELRLVVAEDAAIARVVALTGLTDAAPTHPTLEGALGQQAGS